MILSPKLTDSLNNIAKIMCAIAIAAMVFISFSVYHTNITSFITFLLYLLFYVQLPGLLLVKLSNVSFKHASEEILISFFSGWALIIIEYFTAETLIRSSIVYIVGPLLSILYIFLICTKKLPTSVIKKIKITKLPLSLFLSVVLLAAFTLLNTQFLYPNPDYSSEIYVSIDKAYQMGLISSLSQGYPLVDPWVHGRYVSYHIFTQILLALPVKLFNLSPDFMMMSCNPVLTVYLISLSLYAMFKHFIKSNRSGLYCLAIVMSQMFIARTATASYLFRIVFISDNFGGAGISCAVACLILVDIITRSTPGSKRQYALNTLLFMLLTGIKAPVALTLAGGLIGTCALGLILRKPNSGKAIVTTATSLFGFSFVYVLLLSNNSSATGDNSSIIKFGKMTGICYWKAPLIESMNDLGIPGPARLIVILLVFFIFFFSVFALSFAIGYLRELILVLRSKKPFNYGVVSVYASSLVGFIMMMFLNYSGHSQIYFGTVLVPFAPLISFLFIEDYPNMKLHITRFLRQLSLAWMCIAILFTSYALVSELKNQVPAAINSLNPTIGSRPYSSLSKDEYEAMLWIKKNTPEDTLIASQMYASVPQKDYNFANRWHNCHFLYAAYSCRYFYLEGSGFSLTDGETEKRRDMINNTQKLYDPNNIERGDVARSLGINYVVATKKIHSTPSLASNDYLLVFSNKDIDIYQIAPYSGA